MPMTLHIPEKNGFDNDTNSFISIKATDIQLEHSLISLKKWEQKYHIPFLDNKHEKTAEEWLYYIRCMTITQNVDEDVFKYMSMNELKQVMAYIEDPMTATWFNDKDKKGAATKKNEVITAEIIYYWMIALNIPIQFEKWHLNQLLTLIRVVNIKNNPSKMGRKEQAMQRQALNAKRRAAMHSKG